MRVLTVLIGVFTLGCGRLGGGETDPDPDVVSCVSGIDTNGDLISFTRGGCHTFWVDPTETELGEELVQICGLQIVNVSENVTCVADAAGTPVPETLLYTLAFAPIGSKIEGYEGLTGGCQPRGNRPVSGQPGACTPRIVPGKTAAR